jgi:hypothetical protein
MENIYEFTLNKKVKKQVEKTRKTKDGEEETVLSSRTVNSPVKFIIKKPTRRVADEAELFYSIELSKASRWASSQKQCLLKSMLIMEELIRRRVQALLKSLKELQ